MRRAIETAPKNGTVVILEDGQSGAFELAHWSTEMDCWLDQSGKCCPFNPTFWLVLQRSPSLQKSNGPAEMLAGRTTFIAASAHGERTADSVEQDWIAEMRGPVADRDVARRARLHWSRLVGASIGAAMVLASMLGMYFRGEVTAYLYRLHEARLETAQSSSRPDETRKELSGAADERRAMSELRENLAQEHARRKALKAQLDALETQLKEVRRDLVTQAVRAAEASDDARRQAKAAAELQQALTRESAKTSALQNQLRTVSTPN